MQDRKMYPSLDIVKFIMALLILMQHTANEWAHSTGLVHAFFGLGNFAVPFFFACSGFLFFSKFNTLDNRGQKDYYRKWSIRIGKMYLVWSLIYFCFVFAGWVDRGLSWGQPAQYFHRALVFCHYLVLAGSVDRGQHRVLDETSLHKGCFLDNGHCTPDRRQFVRQLQQCDDS